MYIVLCILLILYPCKALADEAPPDRLSHRWASWFSGQDMQVTPKPAPTAPYQVTLAPTSYTAPITPANVRRLTQDGDGASTKGMLASTTWLKRSLSAETEVAANQA